MVCRHSSVCGVCHWGLTRHSVLVESRFCFATVLSVYNKWMFSAEHFGFPYPLFVTTMHMFVQFILATLIRNIWPKRFRPQNAPSRVNYMWVAHHVFAGVEQFPDCWSTLKYPFHHLNNASLPIKDNERCLRTWRAPAVRRQSVSWTLSPSLATMLDSQLIFTYQQKEGLSYRRGV